MIEQKIKAKYVQEGDFLPGLDNGYVYRDPEENTGYLSYPTPSGGYHAGMPSDTVVISFHDADGEENYLLMGGDSYLTVKGEVRDMDEEED